MKKLVFITSYIGILLLVIFVFILATLYSFYKNGSNSHKSITSLHSSIDYKSLPEERHVMDVTISEKDIRIEELREFLIYYKSPLVPYAEKLVTIADKYRLDYRLVPAIAMQESNLCKKIPDNSYNCWGFGIYGKKVTRFSNYSEAIETVSKTLANKYIALGYVEPHEIMKKYTPSSNGSWGNGVSYFMSKLPLDL